MLLFCETHAGDALGSDVFVEAKVGLEVALPFQSLSEYGVRAQAFWNGGHGLSMEGTNMSVGVSDAQAAGRGECFLSFRADGCADP